jgi:hypothetical protein
MRHHFFPCDARHWREEILARARQQEVTDAHRRDMDAVLRKVTALQRLYGSVASEQHKVMECVDGLRCDVGHLMGDRPLSMRTMLGSPLSKAASTEWVELE